MFMNAQPAEMSSVASVLASIGATKTSANAAAAAPTTAVISPSLPIDPAGTLLAAQHTALAGLYQAVGAVDALFHQSFAATMGVSGASYAATEAANAIATL